MFIDMSMERHISKHGKANQIFLGQTPHRDAPPSESEIFGDREFSEIELGLLQMQILWILNHKSTHGYELMKILNEIKKTKVAQGTLYPTLQSLEKRSLIKRHDEYRKTIYSITLKGRKVMNETCMDFSKTFFGIFQNYVCEKCVGHDEHVGQHHHKDELIKIGEKK